MIESAKEKDDQSLCANGCGFFGTKENRNLCSKCYRDYLKEGSDRSPKTRSPLSSSQNRVASTSGNAVSADASSDAKKKRCESCNKKVGLLGFKCKCGNLFCAVHRLPGKHDCGFNFKAVGAERLFKENPLVKGDKLKDRI